MRTSNINTILGILRHLNYKRRVQLLTLLFVMVISGFAEVFSIAAVIPLLSVLTNANQIWQYPLVFNLSTALGLTSSDQLIFPVTILFCFASIFCVVIRLINLWFNNRLAASIGSDFSCRTYLHILHLPYIEHINQNSSSMITSSTTQIGHLIIVLRLILQTFTALIVSSLILISLIRFDFRLGVTVLSIFLFSYLLVGYYSRSGFKRIGYVALAATKKQLKALQEGLGSIRDVILGDNHYFYVQLYRDQDIKIRIKEAQSQFLMTFPRYVLESFGFIVLAIMAYILSKSSSNASESIPIIGTLALGAQRLLPAFQQAYTGWSGMRLYTQSINEILNIIEKPINFYAYEPILDKSKKFKRSLNLENISFSYKSDGNNVLDRINLVIKPGEFVGIIGKTGSGKSTLLDILMGLLMPTTGKIKVDGNELSNLNIMHEWRRSIAHVPQTIYLSDNTIAENIAFGINKDQIDMERVLEAARKANIHEFIEKDMDGYFNNVGENGIRLSGGQRQRIGLARAFYHDSQVLFLDEATSALDNKTEESILKSIKDYSEGITVFMISHRISTMNICSRIIEIDQGKIIYDGNEIPFY